jgi:hypothetical protein
MAPMFSQAYGFDSPDDNSPFVSVSVSSQTESPDQMQSPVLSLNQNMISRDIRGMAKITPYTLRLQSNRFFDDRSAYSQDEIKKLLMRDLMDRITEANQSLAEFMFPDTVFGFPVNHHFLKNFYNSFLSASGALDPANFVDEESTAIFLNRTISTIAHFLDATKQVSLKPLRYFSAAYSNKPMDDHVIKRKPDIILVPLINGYLRDGEVGWHDVQAIVEQTREKNPPQRLPDTVSIKSYITFCSQVERDFFVALCITGKGFYIVITDHAGQVETDLISFSESWVFIRMLMGLAFLPDNFIGIDTTITRNQAGKASKDTFTSLYQHFPYLSPKPSIVLIASSSNFPVDDPLTETSIPASTPGSSQSFGNTSTPKVPEDTSTIMIGPNIYKVVSVLFKSQSLIGRATTVFLVQLPDNSFGVLKDSWITTDRGKEANFLEGLHIPFGPRLIDHCVLRDTTNNFREYPIRRSVVDECREKRRVVTYPAGVHISDFSSLWELLVAFLDIVIGMKD